MSDAMDDTYKKFRLWLDNNFTMGTPSDDEWEEILRNDYEYAYSEIRTTTEVPVYEEVETEVEVEGGDFSDTDATVLD